jgi:predicted Zn finger-like uncharacterized protein
MILTCPSCGTQYVVKDGAIPPEGRQVRCAACKHSWHQDPEGATALELEDEAPAEAEGIEQAAPHAEEEGRDDEDETLAEATLIDPRTGPEAEERAFEEAVIGGEADGAVGAEAAAEAEDGAPAVHDWREPPDAEATPDMFSPFAAEDEEEPRQRSGLTTILIIALVVVVLAALFWFFAPLDLKARLGLAAGGASPLALVISHRDRQKLESGNELLTVTGRVINPTANEQDVPPLQARLTNRGGKVVYSWTIAPPARSLPAGASASFNSAEVNVPPGGEFLTVTVGEPKG